MLFGFSKWASRNTDVNPKKYNFLGHAGFILISIVLIILIFWFMHALFGSLFSRLASS